MVVIDIGIFAYNEAGKIGHMLRSLLAQDLFTEPSYNVCLHILANGCTDGTITEAQQVISEHSQAINAVYHDFPEGGKSRTWNRFVHDVSRPDAEVLAFLDADIQIPEHDMLRKLCEFLRSAPHLSGTPSQPVKDIAYDPSLRRGFMDKLIASAGGTLNDWKNAICGQLYLLKADVARSFYMPIGLPGEDGFVRAMVLTRNFSEEGRPEDLIDGQEGLFHVYESERSIGALIKHQTRLVIGSAINAMIYARLRNQPEATRMQDLKQSATDPDWLPRLLKDKLPRFPYGYVPTHFLFKRVQYWLESPNKFRPKRILVTALGFVFDAVVYVRAQLKMWRGAGAGYW